MSVNAADHSMTKIVLKGHIDVGAGDLAAVRDELPKHIESTRAEAGCLVFEVAEVAGRPGRFSVYEEFISKAAFELHQRRVAASHWGTVSAGATRQYSLTEVGDD